MGDLAPSPICDWFSFRHVYKPGQGRALESGKLLRINADGEPEWESPTWSEVRSPSSDTSVRVRCDGKVLEFSGNPGRFGFRHNMTGVGVADAFDSALAILRAVPGLVLEGIGERGFHHVSDEDRALLPSDKDFVNCSEWGTFIRRLDLAANFQTDSYSNLALALSARRLGQRRAQMGKYGPTWGYDAKRGQWVKAKLYDKIAELEGRRSPSHGPTVARFEVQLGSEVLRQRALDSVSAWKGNQMENVVFGRFAQDIFRDSVGVENWSDIPPRLRQHAIMWRDGIDPRSYLKHSAYYVARAKLLAYGVDIGVPCNVMALVQRVRVVSVVPLVNLRAAA